MSKDLKEKDEGVITELNTLKIHQALGRFRFKFINDAGNMSDCFTKCHPWINTHFDGLLYIMTNGYAKIQLLDTLGRRNLLQNTRNAGAKGVD